MPPRSKKRRAAASSAASEQNTPPSLPPKRKTWPGWCEVESEPAFFNTILHDIGVRGIKIQEVLGLDDELLAILPQPVYAVIFLFRYRADTKDEKGTNCPPNIWFANQVPDYACASVALLNIVMNIPDLELGHELNRFKTFTQRLDPVGKGDAIADYDFVRSVHNSFARENDMLTVDVLLKDKQAKFQKKQKLAAANATKMAKAAEKAAAKAAQKAEGAATKAANGIIRTMPSRRAKTSKPAPETPEPTDDDAFHFIAYMPIDGQVWKLDGMDDFPHTLGVTPSDVDWLSIIQTELMARMLEYQEGQIEFSLMAVVKDPMTDVRQQLAENIKSLIGVNRQLDQISPQWRSFVVSDDDTTISGMNVRYGISEHDINNATIPESISKKLSVKSLEDLTLLRQEIITAQASCRASISDQMQLDHDDAVKAMHRRYDYGSFVDGWLHALAEEDALVGLLEKEDA